MGCPCSKSDQGTMTNKILHDPTVATAETYENQPEFINDDTAQKDNTPLLNPPPDIKVITIQDSESDSPIEPDVIKKLLEQVDFSDD